MTMLAPLPGAGDPVTVTTPSSAPVSRRAAARALPMEMRWQGRFEGPVLLHDGRVLAVGGWDSRLTAVADTALYDPAVGDWSAAAPLGIGRRLHTATVLADGRVLVAGGVTDGQSYVSGGLSSAELYDPATGGWSPTGGMTGERYGHSATLLPDGRVLVAGGERIRSADAPLTLSSAELYDPATGSWTATGSMHDARWQHQAVALLDGRVLVMDAMVDTGYPATAGPALCELYDPAVGSWSALGTTGVPRMAHQAVQLPDGTVFAVGGGNPWPSDDATFDAYRLADAESFARGC